jgi:hypothetical protein
MPSGHLCPRDGVTSSQIFHLDVPKPNFATEPPKAPRFQMTETQTAPSVVFTPNERAYIRNELDIFFSTLPTVAEGFQLKTWRGGPDRGKPKISPVAKGLLDRGRPPGTRH